MIIDPATLAPRDLYRFMIHVVVPRPIAWISTVSAAGVRNLAPYSFFNALTSRPPLLGVSINARPGGPKDTLANIRETGDFVVNLVDEPLAEGMVRSSGEWPPEVDEFEVAGVTAAPSDLVRAPRVAESPVSMECRLHREIPLGDTTFVIGEIVRARVADDRLTDGWPDVEKLRPVGRLGGEGYALLGRLLRIPRPKVERPAGPGGG
jgi:flavin reductase (DIM6/NTAB) family NADH-FMN oxidoreductase RutF